MSSTYSPPPSDCGSVEAMSSCSCSNSSQHAAGECLRIIASKYGPIDPIAPLTPQPSPTRRRPEESILMDDLRRAREEMRALREELQKTRDERDKWKIRNHDVPSECYHILKQHRLQFEMSLKTLQHLDAPAAIKRLEAHEQYMEHLFAKDSSDFAAKVQTVIQEIQFVKTTMGGDTLRWRLYSALNLMLHISRGLQKILAPRPGNIGSQQNSPTVACDDYLKSTLKSADVQLMSTVNEIRERNMDDYFLAFRERFAPEYDLIHNEYAQEFYEKTKVLMVHMCSRLRALALPQPRLDEVVSRNISNEEQDDLRTTWI